MTTITTECKWCKHQVTITQKFIPLFKVEEKALIYIKLLPHVIKKHFKHFKINMIFKYLLFILILILCFLFKLLLLPLFLIYCILDLIFN